MEGTMSEYLLGEGRLELEMEIEALIERAGIERPPIHPRRVARRLGITLHARKELAARGVYLRRGEAEFIYFRRDDRREREHFAIAREIVQRTLFGEVPQQRRPPHADRLSAQGAMMLLLPRNFFEPHAEALDWDLLRLKKIYTTASHEVIARRMTHFRPCIVRIYDNGKRSASLWPPSLRRSATFEGVEGELLSRIVASQAPASVSFTFDQKTCSFPARMDGWPIFEREEQTGMIWERVILVTHLGMAGSSFV
ncbi:MAG: hypothetical protein D6812_01935 [Deltaproteobacteria bacterium]|nr:MAG: hypothetical protein D6812_01935 [Deltaproteobacteria bacterium]